MPQAWVIRLLQLGSTSDYQSVYDQQPVMSTTWVCCSDELSYVWAHDVVERAVSGGSRPDRGLTRHRCPLAILWNRRDFG